MITANELREMFSQNREKRIETLTNKASELNAILEDSIRKRTPLYEDSHGILRAGKDFQHPFVCFEYYSKECKGGIKHRTTLGLIHLYLTQPEMMKHLCEELNEKCKKLKSESGEFGEKPDFEENAKWLISILDEFDKTARAFKQENEQWFLNWQDAINEISVR